MGSNNFQFCYFHYYCEVITAQRLSFILIRNTLRPAKKFSIDVRAHQVHFTFVKSTTEARSEKVQHTTFKFFHVLPSLHFPHAQPSTPKRIDCLIFIMYFTITIFQSAIGYYKIEIQMFENVKSFHQLLKLSSYQKEYCGLLRIICAIDPQRWINLFLFGCCVTV